MRWTSGHTLLELAVALAIVATLATVAAPGFTRLLAEIRGAAAVNELLGALDAARRLAATRGQTVSLCATDGSGGCVATQGRGFAVVATATGSTIATVLIDRSLPDSQSLAINRSSVAFSAGGLAATPATLTLCDRRGRGSARAIIVSRSTRPRVSGLDASGRPLACPP